MKKKYKINLFYLLKSLFYGEFCPITLIIGFLLSVVTVLAEKTPIILILFGLHVVSVVICIFWMSYKDAKDIIIETLIREKVLTKIDSKKDKGLK